MSAVLLTVRQVADTISKSDAFVRNLINTGQLPAKRVGTNIGVRPGDLETWIDSLEDVSQ